MTIRNILLDDIDKMLADIEEALGERTGDYEKDNARQTTYEEITRRLAGIMVLTMSL